MYYIGLDVHKKTISYCVKDVSGRIQQQGTIPATRTELSRWMDTLPQPWTVAMEGTIFTGWVYDHLLPRIDALFLRSRPRRCGWMSAAQARYSRYALQARREFAAD